MYSTVTFQGFWVKLGASGSFYPKHVNLPMEIQYFSLSDDNAPSPYLVSGQQNHCLFRFDVF